MISTARPLIAGNWKMNGLAVSLMQAADLRRTLDADPAAADIVVCPPVTLLNRMADLFSGSPLAVGAQDCHARTSGPYTGDISAEMLADSGARFVILGHSERRTDHGETDAAVAAKALAAVRAGLTPILCVGETRQGRDGGATLAVVEAQIVGSIPLSVADAAFAVAYEPCWAIGSGLTPTLDQIAQVHAAIRRVLVTRLGKPGRTTPILYGGSVQPQNAAGILGLDEVGGALVGGASIDAADFLKIIRAASKAEGVETVPAE